MSNFCYPVNTPINTDDMLKIDLYYLANTLTNTNDILKIAPCYLANTLTNTNDKADNFTKERSITSNQLLMPHYQLSGA